LIGIKAAQQLAKEKEGMDEAKKARMNQLDKQYQSLNCAIKTLKP